MANPEAAATKRRGPNDPERRARIAKAAIEVVAQKGIDGLTHRAVAAALADLVMGYIHEQYRDTVVEYDLYIAALHRPRLRPASAAWDDALIKLFSSRTDPLTGRLLAGLFCGLLMQAALADPQPARLEIETLFRRAIEGP